MSLEEKLLANTAALDRNNELLEKLVARAEAAGAVSSSSATTAADTKQAKGKGKGKASETETTDAGTTENTELRLTHDEVKQVVGAWLGEFKGVEGDPETDARKAAVKAAIDKVTNKAGSLLTDIPADQLHRVVAWLDKKKVADVGHGAGRLTAVPSEAAAGGDDDI